MGHQNHAGGLRRSLTENWSSKWSTSVNNKKQYQFLLDQDLVISEFIKSFCKEHSIDLGPFFIKRSENHFYIFLAVNLDTKTKQEALTIELFSETLKNNLEQFTQNKVSIFISSITSMLYNADLLSNFIADNLENRKNYSFIFQTILRALDSNKGSSKLQSSIQGIKIHLSGRLNGVDRARTVKFNWGSLPLNTLSSRIEFAKNTAFTKYGTLGIKVWVSFKEVK